MAIPVEHKPSFRMTQSSIINVILGAWLFISAFAWPHTTSQMSNTWIVGVLCVICALISVAVPWVRYLNTALAVWLFVTTWALPSTSPGTVWNNILVAIAMFVVSLTPPSTSSTIAFPRRRSPPTPA
jgi:multisubunit Na+/H+ antiporter MnhB subunit